MNHIKNAVTAVVVAAALSLVTACGDLEPPVNDIGKTVEKKAPAPKAPVRTNPNRMDFGDGEATVPAKPRPSVDHNAARLDFGDIGRG